MGQDLHAKKIFAPVQTRTASDELTRIQMKSGIVEFHIVQNSYNFFIAYPFENFNVQRASNLVL